MTQTAGVRASRGEKDRSHARIITTASRLMRERGIDNTSVAEVMQGADLTVGGFYRHFDSKDALVIAAVAVALDDMAGSLEAQFDIEDAADALARYRSHCLAEQHLDNPVEGCPIAALAGDAGRGSGALKTVFGEGVRRTISALARGMRGADSEKRSRSARQLALLVGAVVLARASDPDTARSVLAACDCKVS